MQLATPQELPSLPNENPATEEDILTNIASLQMYRHSLARSYQISIEQVQQAIKDQITQVKALQESQRQQEQLEE